MDSLAETVRVPPDVALTEDDAVTEALREVVGEVELDAVSDAAGEAETVTE